MAGRITASPEQLKPDSRYNSKLVSKFINCLMWDGKKSTSKRIFYGAMDIIDKKVEDKEPLEVFEEAINNIKPRVEVRSKRVGGANYQVPIQVNPKRQQSLAIRWVLQSIRSKSGKPMKEFLAVEIIDAYNKTGASVSMRENVHRMAEANKAFAHFAW